MDKDYRLFLRNLPPDIDNNKLQTLFEEHGTVKSIDIKDKIQNDGSRIAFINFSTTDGRLNTCFRAVNGTLLSGNAIHVEVAKESFLDRLKREREEAAKSKEPSKEPNIRADYPIEKINIKTPANFKTKPTKRIYNFDQLDNNDSVQNNDEPETSSTNFTYDPALQVETIPAEKPLKIPRQIPEKIEPRIEKIPEKKILSESEIKRLASVKQKRQAFKAKEHMISISLKTVDSNGARNKKVVFSDDIDKIHDYGDKRSKSLFDDDNDDDEDQADWNDDKFQHDDKRSAKLKMSLNNLGRDKRFALDERFLDDDDEVSKVETAEENEEMKNETKWQLGILQNVLGKPFKSRDDNLNAKKQNRMVRYDPTASGHRAHELEMMPKPVKAKKVKQATNEAEPEQEPPVVVSSDVFYSVSDNLTESLKVQEEFSLLKTFGTATPADKNRSDDYSVISNSAQSHNWDVKNPFKYESSDDEGADPSMDQLTCKNDSSSKNKTNNHLSATKETFFYDVNDQLFHDVEEFFKTNPSTTENFKSVRRELRQIVRSKVRNNVKKSTPWRNKKIGNKKPKTR